MFFSLHISDEGPLATLPAEPFHVLQPLVSGFAFVAGHHAAAAVSSFLDDRRFFFFSFYVHCVFLKFCTNTDKDWSFVSKGKKSQEPMALF